MTELLAAEESYLRQRSRVKWLKEGDQNTRFFHNFIKGKLTRSRISSLVDSDGNSLTEEKDIKREILSFYMDLLGTEDTNCTGSIMYDLHSLLVFRLSENLATSLSQPFTKEDIKAVVHNLPSNKSPGRMGTQVNSSKHPGGL